MESLARLRRNGLVASTWRESAQGPPRRYYQLTEAGGAAVSAFAVHWLVSRDAVDRILEEAQPA